MKIPHNLKTVTLFFIASLFCNRTWAQVELPIERPKLKVGERWRYKTIDLWNNQDLSTSEVELVEINEQQLTFRSKNSLQQDTNTSYTTLDLQPCRSLQNSENVVCGGALKFPLQIGNMHKFEKLPWLNGNGYVTETCEVKGLEKITVPAGTFDTVRVECEGLWNRVFGDTSGGRSGQVKETFWYSPDVKLPVKNQYIDYRSSGGVYNKTERQLVEFIRK